MEKTSSTGIRKGLSIGAFRGRDVGVEGIFQTEDGGLADFGLVAFKGLEGRAVDDRGVVAGEVVLGEKFANFHLDELEEFGVVDHVALVHEHDDVAERRPDERAGCAHGSEASGRRQRR
jgi:hypothetical protein